MRSLSLMPFRGRRSTLSEPSSLRVEVCPPSLRHAPASRWQRLLFWLLAPAPRDAAPPVNRLPDVRDEFLSCLSDVGPELAHPLHLRVDSARSLRELWHLRAEMYNTIGRAHSQAEAEARLSRLNRHFPTRAPRSGFAPLTP